MQIQGEDCGASAFPLTDTCIGFKNKMSKKSLDSEIFITNKFIFFTVE